MGEPDKAALLSKIEFFKSCTDRQLQDIAKLSVDRHLEPGDVLCRQGDYESDVFVLVDGEAAVHIDGSQVATVGTGEVVGEFSMMHGGRRSATLQAITPLHVIQLDPREVDSVLSVDPGSIDQLGPRKKSDG